MPTAAAAAWWMWCSVVGGEPAVHAGMSGGVGGKHVYFTRALRYTAAQTHAQISNVLPRHTITNHKPVQVLDCNASTKWSLNTVVSEATSREHSAIQWPVVVIA